MTNRQKLIETNIYDMLIQINKEVQGYGARCVLELVDYVYTTHQYCDYSCQECIQRYLNEEAKP